MARHMTPIDTMEPEVLETLSAFADGEPVETSSLLRALEQPGARHALIDFVRLRAAVENDPSRPSPEVVRAIRVRLAPSRVPWWRRAVALPAPVAAAIVAAFVLSFWLFARLAPVRPEAVEEPPPAKETLYFDEAAYWKTLQN